MSKLILVALFLGVVFLVGCVPPSQAGAEPHEMGRMQFILTTIWFVVIGVAVYIMLVVQPEKKKQEAQKELMSSLKKNDEVVLTSGIFGKVSSVKESAISVEIAPNVKVRVRPQDVRRHSNDKKPVEKPKEKYNN